MIYSFDLALAEFDVFSSVDTASWEDPESTE